MNVVVSVAVESKKLDLAMDKVAERMGGSDVDVAKVFDLLESSNLELVQEIKTEICETFNKTKDNWLVAGLFEFYLYTGSQRCAEILYMISKEPHDKYLIDKITEGIRSPSKEIRKKTLEFFGQVVTKQPSWLYKVTQQSLFKELIRLLKDIFDVFGRLATWAQMSHNIPKEHLLHLQVGLYSLFHRLYAMYPCNFLSHLRHNFSSPEKRVVFLHTIMPMLEKVKMHPALVTSTKEGELLPQRWRSKEYHQVIAECSKISLDVYESSFPEEITPTFTRLGSLEFDSDPAASSSATTIARGGSLTTTTLGDWTIESLLKLPPSSLISQSMRTSDLTSLVTYLDDTSSTAPPTPLSVGGGGGPILLNRTTTSPPETAMEATPENTPIRDKVHFKVPPTPPPLAATAVQQLNFANIEHIKDKYANRPPYYFPQIQGVTSTPFNSVPSSPLPVSSNTTNTANSTEFPSTTNVLPTIMDTTHRQQYPLVRRDSIFDPAIVGTALPLRRDSLIFQRLQKVQLEQLNNQASQQSTDQQSSLEPSNYVPAVKPVQDSTLLPLPQRKASVPAPITIPPTHSSLHDSDPSSASSTSATSEFLSDRDRDRPTGGPLTPMLPSSGQSGILDPDLSLIALDEDSVVDNCKSVGCPKGGLHMADHKQMIAFAKRVSRLRFHSQCAPNGSDGTTGNQAPSPGTSPSSSTTGTSGLQHFKARLIKRSFSMPNIQKPVFCEESEVVVEIRGETSARTETPTQQQQQTAAPSISPTFDNQLIQQPVTSIDPVHQPYEHLFQQILPTVLSPPVDSRTLPSPHVLLDLCLMKAATLHNGAAKTDEVSMLRGQVALLHGQLLFERHRREAHALRNRRLAGKCREMQTLEEKNNSMRRENHNLEKDIVLLKQEVVTQRNMALVREKDLDSKISALEKKLETYRVELSQLKDSKCHAEIENNLLQEKYLALQKESDQKKADLFSLENEIKYLQKYLDLNSELKSAYDVSQKEILLLGELLRYQQEAKANYSNNSPDTRRYYQEEMDDVRQTCAEEIRGFKNALESKMSQCEALSGMIQDLEKKLEKREAIIMEQKLGLQEAARDHTEKLKEYQNKYEFVKACNHKLDLENLNLQEQITKLSYSSRSARARITSSPSNGEMSPAGNSNHSDVDSAASAAGYQLSPDNHPCFFGSPQFDLPPDDVKDFQGPSTSSAAIPQPRRE
ncbi:Hamartin [Folsomia candida]|uniref:Hamartin n=1 Tax=Folsomia candida TaxID=158441 RepID=A0A226ED54_FOLCA|nr:Hamartin [Folsomia candida]